jgi:hypothetical protein
LKGGQGHQHNKEKKFTECQGTYGFAGSPSNGGAP